MCKLLTPMRKAGDYLSYYSDVKANEICRVAQEYALEALDGALPRKGKIGSPRFKKSSEMKNHRLTITFSQLQQVAYNGEHELIYFKFPKVGLVHCKGLKIPKGAEPKEMTLVKQADGWGIRIMYKMKRPDFVPALKGSNSSIGIDLGINPLMAFSDGTKIENPRFSKEEASRMAFLQKQLKRKTYGSNNYRKINKQIAKLHQKIARRRKDFFNKLSCFLTDNYQHIAIEDLNIAGLSRGMLSKAFADAGFGIFLLLLKQKADQKGRIIHLHGRYDRSTGVCPACGVVGDKLPLSKKEWECQEVLCLDRVHDRDVAAAKIIELATKSKYIPASVAKVAKKVKKQPMRKKKTNQEIKEDNKKKLTAKAGNMTVVTQVATLVGKSNPEVNKKAFSSMVAKGISEFSDFEIFNHASGLVSGDTNNINESPSTERIVKITSEIDSFTEIIDFGSG
jgi:putative transposase